MRGGLSLHHARARAIECELAAQPCSLSAIRCRGSPGPFAFPGASDDRPSPDPLDPLAPAVNLVLRAVLLYRLAHLCAFRFSIPGRIVAGVIDWICRHFYGCAISPHAFIDGGLILPHPQNIVIGGDVIIGPRAYIFHNVTIRRRSGKVGMPVLSVRTAGFSRGRSSLVLFESGIAYRLART